MFSFSLARFRSHQPHQILNWVSPSHRASFHPTPTPACPRITFSSRRSAPRTSRSRSTLRETSLSLMPRRIRKASVSPSIQSFSTCRFSSCTVRCLCVPKDLRATKNYHWYVVLPSPIYSSLY